MTARAATRMYAALLGHIDGVKRVSPERLQTIAAPAFSGIDQVMGFPTTWALGYSPARLGSSQPRPGSTFGMVGSNGTAATPTSTLASPSPSCATTSLLTFP